MAQTIAALSTAPMRSGVGVIRISGPEARAISDRIFRPARPEAYLPRHMTYGGLYRADGRLIDRVLAVWFEAGASFTGEEVVELHCHGSLPVLRAALAALYGHGARPAEPGEFTKRAFLNGKLDLSRAEAIGDLIAAESEEAAVNAAAQLDGALYRKVSAIYEGLLGVLSHFQAVVDYPEEDIAPFETDAALREIRHAAREVSALREGYQRGRYLREGVECAIVGRPNVGKSSLLNALAGTERAIVTDQPGTTRDVVEVSVSLGGVPLRLRDTAGIRPDADMVERIGVEKAREAAKQAALRLLVVDGSAPLTEEDRALMAELAAEPPSGPTIVLANKSDLPRRIDGAALAVFGDVISVSAKTGAGIDRLAEHVAELFGTDRLRLDGTLITNARQEGACAAAEQALRRAEAAMAAGVSPDAVLFDMEQAAERLGDIIGRHTPEDVIEQIFANFCVGK